MKTFKCRYRAILLAVMVLLPIFACFADIRTSLPQLGRDDGAGLPIDSRIGRIVQPDSSEHHVFLASALGAGSYDYAWMETYVLESSRNDVSLTIGQWLSENLPVEAPLMSSALENGDGSVSIGVRVGDGYVCFVVANVEGLGLRIVAASIIS